MHVLLIVLGLILGTAAPASLGAITALQWVEIGLTLGNDAIKLPGQYRQFQAIVNSPAFRVWVAANGEAAMRLQPGITTFNGIAY